MSDMTNGRAPATLARPAYWAGAAPLLCAVHCLFTPAMVVLMPWLAPVRELEAVLLVGSALLAVGFTGAGVRVHGRRTLWVPVAVGVVAVAAALLLPEGSGWETVAAVGGSLLLATGLLLNARLRHVAQCRHCGCPAHSE